MCYFRIQQLTFVCNATPTAGVISSSALVIFQSRSVLIFNSTLKGSDNSNNVTAIFGSLRVENNSEVTVINCHFNSNSAQHGGGISLIESSSYNCGWKHCTQV